MLELNGLIDISRLRSASRLVAVMEMEPLLGCRFVDHWYRPYWERVKDLDRISSGKFQQSCESPETLDSFVAEPCDPCKRSQFRILVCRGSTDQLWMNCMCSQAFSGVYVTCSIAHMEHYVSSKQTRALRDGIDRELPGTA
jgi:NRPS condensation-like uncharacterized protein